MAVTFEFSAPIEEPSEAMAALRQRIASIDPSDNAIQHEAYYLALSAAVWRLVYFGVEDTFQLYTPRDLACTSLVAGGAIINFLIRTAYTRAVIEDDEQLWRTMEDCGIAPTTVAWHAHLRTVPVDNLAQTLADISDPEELATARTIILPRAAGLATTEWLWQVPVETPTISAAMAVRLLALRPDLASSVGTLLAQRRNVLLAREPDPALALSIFIAANAIPIVLKETGNAYLAQICGGVVACLGAALFVAIVVPRFSLARGGMLTIVVMLSVLMIAGYYHADRESERAARICMWLVAAGLAGSSLALAAPLRGAGMWRRVILGAVIAGVPTMAAVAIAMRHLAGSGAE